MLVSSIVIMNEMCRTGSECIVWLKNGLRWMTIAKRDSNWTCARRIAIFIYCHIDEWFDRGKQHLTSYTIVSPVRTFFQKKKTYWFMRPRKEIATSHIFYGAHLITRYRYKSILFFRLPSNWTHNEFILSWTCWTLYLYFTV